MYSKLIKKVTTVVLLISLIAIQFPSYAFATVNGAKKSEVKTYTYSQIKDRRDALKAATVKYNLNKALGAYGAMTLVFSYLNKAIPGSMIKVASSVLLVDKVVGVQRSYSDLCNVYNMFDNAKDSMETNKYAKVQIKQNYEYKVTRIFGDHTAEWYLDGDPYVSSYLH